MHKHLLVLNIPPALEDDLIDYLLAVPEAMGFTSYPVRGHGEQIHPSLAEQVTGRRKRIQFELVLPEGNIEQILENLVDVVGHDIYYWQQPVTRAGHL